MRVLPRSLLIGTALVALTVVGCGGGGATKEPTSTQAPAKASSGAAPKTASEQIKDFEFAPTSITVAAGGKVTWTNRDTANHTVTFSASGAPKSIGNLRQDQKASVSFDKAGTYKYVCQYHPNMHGTVVVR